MDDIDNYARYLKRRQRAEKLRNRQNGSYGRCPFCGRDGTRLDEHHYGRQELNPETIIACRDCHDHFRRTEQFEHPPLLKGPKSPEEKEGRMLLGLSDILEVVAYQVRRIALKKLNPAEIESGPE